jgi:hypothetical protein
MMMAAALGGSPAAAQEDAPDEPAAEEANTEEVPAEEVAPEEAPRRAHTVWVNPYKPFLGLAHAEYQLRLAGAWAGFVNSEYMFGGWLGRAHPVWVSTLGGRWFVLRQERSPWLDGLFVGPRVGYSLDLQAAARHDVFVGAELGWALVFWRGRLGVMGRGMAQWSVRRAEFLPGAELLVGVYF